MKKEIETIEVRQPWKHLFQCRNGPCGYQGEAEELEEKSESNDILVCPICGSADWVWL